MNRPPSPLFRGMMLWALYAVPLVVAVRPVGVPLLDPDIWWHLAVGQWVVEHQAVTSTDPFSQEGRPWVAYSWLYEVLVYGLYRAFGLAGIIAYRAAMALAVVAAVHSLVRRLDRRLLVSAGLTGAAVLALSPLFSERPWLFTMLFGTLTLHAVVALRRGESPWWVWTLPLVFALWANIHIQFVYGLILLGLACAAPWIDRAVCRRAGEVWDAGPADAARSSIPALAVLCLLATFANPYHARLYLVVVEYATQPGPYRYVNELKAMRFREVSDWVVLGLTLAAAYALGRKKPPSFEVLLLAGAAVLAFRAARDLWLLVLADLVVLASFGPGDVPEEDRYRPGWVSRAAIVAGLALVVLGRVATQDLSPAGLWRSVARRFPAEAVDHVRQGGYAGPLFNDFNWGGYLIWALPELPVAIDGRTNLHGDERLDRYGRVWAGLGGWRDDPDLSAAGVVIAPAEGALASLLRLDPRFALTYEDEVANVFARAIAKP